MRRTWTAACHSIKSSGPIAATRRSVRSNSTPSAAPIGRVFRGQLRSSHLAMIDPLPRISRFLPANYASRSCTGRAGAFPQHFLYLRSEPHQHASFRGRSDGADAAAHTRPLNRAVVSPSSRGIGHVNPELLGIGAGGLGWRGSYSPSSPPPGIANAVSSPHCSSLIGRVNSTPFRFNSSTVASMSSHIK